MYDSAQGSYVEMHGDLNNFSFWPPNLRPDNLTMCEWEQIINPKHTWLRFKILHYQYVIWLHYGGIYRTVK